MTFINQDVLKIFPRTTLLTRKTIIDEKCTCGHFRSNHWNRNAFGIGHGTCGQDGCPCEQFSWDGHVFATTRGTK